jgi:hypothetical protein
MQADRLAAALFRLDAENAQDPHLVDHEGQAHPKELLYARRMTRWLEQLYPEASELLRLAVRAQHIRRWQIPRNTYPMDRAGYLAWRKRMYEFHGDVAEQVMRALGYGEADVGRVRSLISKQRLKADPEAQALEDVAAIVFLENHLAEFARDRDEQNLLNILRRTWAKMSPVGREAALRLQMPAPARELVARALSGPDGH